MVAIFILGLLLRFYSLGIVPAGFHTDEAYFGLNAFSILKTGREITGDFLPVHLRSFLFSPAAYSYFSVPPILFFGLNEFSTRFASALFGSLTIITTYLLVKKLFKKNEGSEIVALVSALFLAVSAWHINLSRVATENVIVVFLISLGVYLYLLWQEKNRPSLFVLSFLSFFVALFTYQAPRSFLPLFLPLLFIFTYKPNKGKTIMQSSIYVLLIILPLIYILLSPSLSFRIRTLSILQNPGTQLVLEEQLREDGVMRVPSVVARLFHNKAIDYSTTFLHNYFQHFSYDFLFTDSGLPERYRVPNMGLLYLLDLPFIISGLWSLFTKNKKMAWFFTGWILLAPVGSAMTFDDVPNLQRTLLVFPALSIIAANGFLFITEQIKKHKVKYVRLAYPLILIFMVYNFAFYLHSYFVHQVVHRPWHREEGYKDLIGVLNQHEKSYNRIVFTDATGSPSIFIFFYNKYNPSLIQKIIKNNTKGENYGSVSFGKYDISHDACPLRQSVDVDPNTGLTTTKIIGQKGVLYVDEGECKLSEEGIKNISVINKGDGTAAFRVLAVE